MSDGIRSNDIWELLDHCFVPSGLEFTTETAARSGRTTTTPVDLGDNSIIFSDFYLLVSCLPRLFCSAGAHGALVIPHSGRVLPLRRFDRTFPRLFVAFNERISFRVVAVPVSICSLRRRIRPFCGVHRPPCVTTGGVCARRRFWPPRPILHLNATETYRRFSFSFPVPSCGSSEVSETSCCGRSSSPATTCMPPAFSANVDLRRRVTICPSSRPL